MAQGVDPSDLEKLIHDCEFENQQIVKLIEHEDSLLENVEREIEWKRTEIKAMEEENSNMDMQVKQLHRDFVQNKENIERQKKTGQILMEQISALTKTLDMLNEKRKNERQEHERMLQHYQGICDRYRKIYESRPAFKQLQEAMARHAAAEKLIQEKQDNIARMKRNINFLKSKKAGKTMTEDEQNFIIKLAETRLANMKLFDEIEHKKHQIQALKQRQLQQQQQHTQQQHNFGHHHNFIDYQTTSQGSRQQEHTKQAYVMDSPMISVISCRDEEDTDMQMEERSTAATQGPAPEQPTHEQGDPSQSWLDNFQRLHVHQTEPAVSSAPPMPVSRPADHRSGRSPQSPYVAYKKTFSANNQTEETVNVHLQISTPQHNSQRGTVSTSSQIRPDCSAGTIKRPCPPDLSSTKPIASRGPPPIPAVPDSLSLRPKIPKLEIRVPTPRVFGRPSVGKETSGSPNTSRENSYSYPTSKENAWNSPKISHGNVSSPQTSSGNYVNVPQTGRAIVGNPYTSRQSTAPQISRENIVGSPSSGGNVKPVTSYTFTSQIQLPQMSADMQYRSSSTPQIQVPKLQPMSHQGAMPTNQPNGPRLSVPYQMKQVPKITSSPRQTMPHQMQQGSRNTSSPNSRMSYQMTQARDVSSPRPSMPHQMNQAPRIPTSPLVTTELMQPRQSNNVQPPQNPPGTRSNMNQVSIPTISTHSSMARTQPTYSPNKHSGYVNHSSAHQQQGFAPGRTQVISPVKNTVQVSQTRTQVSQYPGVHVSASSSSGKVSSVKEGQYPGVYMNSSSSSGQDSSVERNEMRLHGQEMQYQAALGERQEGASQIHHNEQENEDSQMSVEDSQEHNNQHDSMESSDSASGASSTFKVPDVPRRRSPPCSPWAPPPKFPTFVAGVGILGSPPPQEHSSPPQDKQDSQAQEEASHGQEHGSPPRDKQDSQAQQEASQGQKDDPRSSPTDAMEEDIRMKMLGPNEPYYLKLKDDTEEDQAGKTGSNFECQDEMEYLDTDPKSPFNMEKHMRKLEELKKMSPGCPTYTARMMYSKDQEHGENANKEDTKTSDSNKETDKKDQSACHVDETKDFVFCQEFVSFDGKDSTSPNMFGFGGGDASDNACNNSFSLFGSSDDKEKEAGSFSFFGSFDDKDKSNGNFSLFGNVDTDDQSTGEFSLFGAPVDKGAPSPPSALSLFGTGDNDDDDDQGNFQFCPVFSSPVNSPEQKSFSLF